MQNLMVFEGHDVEVFELNGQVLFNPYHVGACLELGESAVRMAVAKMNGKQVIKVKNSDVSKVDIRKLNNAGENFLTESGVYKLVFKSHKQKLSQTGSQMRFSRLSVRPALTRCQNRTSQRKRNCLP